MTSHGFSQVKGRDPGSSRRLFVSMNGVPERSGPFTLPRPITLSLGCGECFSPRTPGLAESSRRAAGGALDLCGPHAYLNLSPFSLFRGREKPGLFPLSRIFSSFEDFAGAKKNLYLINTAYILCAYHEQESPQ